MSLTLGREALTNLVSDDLATRNANKGLIEVEVDAKAGSVDVYTKTENDILLGAKETVVNVNAGLALKETIVNVDTLKGTGWVDESVKGNAEGILAINNRKLSTAITITVGTGGDYATINQALAYATTRYPVYVSASVQPRVTISLLTGFVMAEQVIVDGQDLSWITISGVGEFVITRSALTIASIGGGFPAFNAQNGGFLPIIGALLNMDTSGAGSLRHGIECIYNSRAIVNVGCGVTNAGGDGLSVFGSSTANAQGAIFTGAGRFGLYASRGSIINADTAEATGATTNGVYASNSGKIEANSVNARMGAIDATSDFRIASGSFINKTNGTGGTSQTVNAVNSNGIIFG